jgi:hypothetical protein
MKRGSAAKPHISPSKAQASAAPAGIAISEAAFERDLEEEVATINAARAMLGSAHTAVAAG